MCMDPATLSLITTVGGSVMQAKAASDQAAVNRRVAENNAALSEMAAQDALKRGEQDAADARKRAASVKAAQQVQLAAHGLDIGYGTAGDLLDQTDFFAESDATTLRNNARQEAWSRRSQGENFRAEAANSSPGKALFASALSSAPRVAEKWDAWKKS